MKQEIWFCDCCGEETEKKNMLHANIFPKVGGQRGSLGSKHICKSCYDKIFINDGENKQSNTTVK